MFMFLLKFKLVVTEARCDIYTSADFKKLSKYCGIYDIFAQQLCTPEICYTESDIQLCDFEFIYLVSVWLILRHLVKGEIQVFVYNFKLCLL